MHEFFCKRNKYKLIPVFFFLGDEPRTSSTARFENICDESDGFNARGDAKPVVFNAHKPQCLLVGAYSIVSPLCSVPPPLRFLRKRTRVIIVAERKVKTSKASSKL